MAGLPTTIGTRVGRDQALLGSFALDVGNGIGETTVSRMYVAESRRQAVERCRSGNSDMTSLELTEKRGILAKLAKYARLEAERGTYDGRGGSARQCEIRFSMPSIRQRGATIISEIKFRIAVLQYHTSSRRSRKVGCGDGQRRGCGTVCPDAAVSLQGLA